MDRLSVAVQTGRAWPLGAHWDGRGVNFAVFSANAHAMERSEEHTSELQSH